MFKILLLLLLLLLMLVRCFLAWGDGDDLVDAESSAVLTFIVMVSADQTVVGRKFPPADYECRVVQGYYPRFGSTVRGFSLGPV